MKKIIPLFSGSSGNCTYIKYDDEEILVDAGVSMKMIECALNSINTELSHIKAIFVTHEHTDHIKGVEAISKACGIPVYINGASAEYAVQNGIFFETQKYINEKNALDSVDLNKIHADIFKTPHDSCGSVGYRFTFADGSALGYATDMGYITKGVAEALFGCETVILESNHDLEMLKNGPYPYYLKHRILSDKGHLSNNASADFLPYLFEKGNKKVILAHLSEHNNTPRIAYETNTDALKKEGINADEMKITVAMKSIL
ncbi:MAG: MBL fold metallo-hydrolase [Clostridia bacterium]|nr:MBL fold metallo-hydrolase [Clostridia bacterium]